MREGLWTFDDVIAGRQAFDVGREVGDFPLTRFEGAWPRPGYQLACVVDDHAMGIDMVIRGDDLLSSTPRQMLVYEALGWKPPRFAHVPLVIGADGKRLAKRHGESRIAQFRAAGISAERIVGWAAWRCGQMTKPGGDFGARRWWGGLSWGNCSRGSGWFGKEERIWRGLRLEPKSIVVHTRYTAAQQNNSYYGKSAVKALPIFSWPRFAMAKSVKP